jgi:hypothetical protein
VAGVLFHLPDGPPRLFLAVHHIVVDGVSWRCCWPTWRLPTGSSPGGRAVHLGPPTTSYQHWSRRLGAHVRAGGFDHEIPYWRAVGVAGAPALPTDRAGRNTTAAERTVEVRLDAGQTDALLHRVPPVYRTRINDLLVSAVGRTIADWLGHDRVVFGLEGHGREELFADVDLSRTVGWFTSHFRWPSPCPRTGTGPARSRW